PRPAQQPRQHRSRVSQHDLPVGARRAPHGSRSQTRRHEGRLSSGRRSDWPDRSPDLLRLRVRCDLHNRSTPPPVLCVPDVIYSPGQRLDVAGLAEAAHRNGALLIIDATQSAGGIPIDVGGLGGDALITASYKWRCGPLGVAVMYLAPHLHERLEPGLVGFRSHEQMWDLRADRLKLPPNAHRFEFSTMAYGCAPGLASSIDYLLRLDVGRIFSRNKRLAA